MKYTLNSHPHNLLQKLNPHSATLLLIAVTTLLHLLVAGQVELSVDEAHYALYGAYLDWSYFDHPPMVGWLNSIVMFFSQSEFALRLLPILMFAGVSLVIYQLAQECFPEANAWLGFVSVAVLQSGFLFHIISLAMIPDTPLLLFGLLAMLMLWRAVGANKNESQENQLRNWIYIGLFFGLAGLSKYTAITLVVTAIFFVHFSSRWQIIRTPGPWIALCLSLILISPVFYWNATHDWISFNYQLGHGFNKPDWNISRALLTQLLQFVVYSPGVFVLGLWALITGFRRWQHPGVRFIILFTLPILLLFSWGGGYEESLPHWTSLAWAGLSPLTAFWLMNNWQRPWVRITTWSSGIYSVLFVFIFHSLLFYPWLNMPEDKNILRDLYGWSDAANKAKKLSEEMSESPGDKPVIMVNNWSLGSRLAWYSYPEPVVINDTRLDQFDLWYGGPEKVGRGIMVVPAYFKHPQTLNTKFHSCKQIDAMEIKHHGHTQVTYYFYACYNFQP